MTTTDAMRGIKRNIFHDAILWPCSSSTLMWKKAEGGETSFKGCQPTGTPCLRAITKITKNKNTNKVQVVFCCVLIFFMRSSVLFYFFLSFFLSFLFLLFFCARRMISFFIFCGKIKRRCTRNTMKKFSYSNVCVQFPLFLNV